MPLSILISAGGTGGGVYPAVAVAEAFRRIAPQVNLHFVGSAGGMERDLVPRDLFESYHEVQSGPLNGVGVRRAAISAIRVIIGIVQALGVIGRVRPNALFITGGWATFPAALACWLRRIPIAIFLPDIEPALAIKLLSRLSRLITVTTGDSVAYFPPGTTVVETGYPLRAAMLKPDRVAALVHFGLDSSRKTLLVFGGSRGARSINTVLDAILPDLLADGLQIIHISGELDWPVVQARRGKLLEADRSRYHTFSYLHSEEMGLAMVTADLVVSRAGASILGEFPHFGLPAILIPYPFAWRYQKVNADWLVARGAAIRVNDEAMAAELLPSIRSLFKDPSRLRAMKRASAALDRPDAAGDIARKIIGLAQKS